MCACVSACACMHRQVSLSLLLSLCVGVVSCVHILLLKSFTVQSLLLLCNHQNLLSILNAFLDRQCNALLNNIVIHTSRSSFRSVRSPFKSQPHERVGQGNVVVVVMFVYTLYMFVFSYQNILVFLYFYFLLPAISSSCSDVTHLCLVMYFRKKKCPSQFIYPQ